MVDGAAPRRRGRGARAGSVPGRGAPLARACDALLEATVIGGFSRVGYQIRRAVEGWEEPARIDGAVVVVTGASSGIGRAVALALAGRGAEVVALGRDARRTAAVAGEISSRGGRAEAIVIDLTDGASVARACERIAAGHTRLDGLVHCAGTLLGEYAVSGEGLERTVATHVVGPFRLTGQLARLLWAADRSTIVTMSSGGMYSERFDLAHLVMSEEDYDGVRAYARAKRAQVVLAHEWARRWSAHGVASYAMHPGWVATPGLASALPRFSRLGVLLRRPEEGADTAVWLACGGPRPCGAGAPGAGRSCEEGIWHDRHLRREHYLPWTRPVGGRADQGQQLWEWCARHDEEGGR
jgi:NAD(P)-dependent dehydrogenase (short-subunit alcohol dehydrogenase family)